MLSAVELLKPHALLLAQVNELAGLSAAAFQSFYQPALNVFARFVQQLPASQRHHHADKGGLITHTLEVCVLALKIRRSYLLSAQAGAEEIAKKQDLWTYAVFLAALFHDLAKPAAYQRVEIFSTPGGGPVWWEPYAGFIDEQGSYYRATFKPGNVHLRHEKMTPLLVPRITPIQGMQWLSSDPMIFAHWLATITGDYPNAGAIGAIISQADVQSVSTNFGGAAPMAAMAKPAPPADKKTNLAPMPDVFEGDGLEERMGLDDAVTTLDEFDPLPSDDEIAMDENPLGDCISPILGTPNLKIQTLERPEAEINPEREPAVLGGLMKNNPPLEFKRPDTTPARQRTKKAKAARDNAPDPANDFIAWLRLGIQQKSILVNNAKAPLHVVAEGVFLATPGIFQCYAKDKDLANWESTQKSVLKKRWHLMNANKVNVFTYQVTGDVKSTLVNGLLFDDPAFIFGSSNIPNPNPHLTAMTIAEW